MAEAAAPTVRPYHHGDLQRALVEAAARILERDGPNAMSLRAVAREAGVSPAAPYHHFKDKDELMAAVARQGFEAMSQAMRTAGEGAEGPHERLVALGVAYVVFARDHPALYHVMFDWRRRGAVRPNAPKEAGGAYQMVKEARYKASDEKADPDDLELATIAGWCAAHGLAEMSQSREFDELKQRLGGDIPFFKAVLDHLGMFSNEA